MIAVKEIPSINDIAFIIITYISDISLLIRFVSDNRELVCKIFAEFN